MAEAMHGLVSGSIGILAVATETPSAVLRMTELLTRQLPRLRGMTWGAEDLSAALGAGDPRAPDGSWGAVYEYARVQCLLACHALHVQAIDTVFVDFRDAEGCRRNAVAARHDGFTGKIAIHPDQVPIINAAFAPTPEEIAWAGRVVSAFAAGQGAIALDGRMLDVPHLKAAQRLLAQITQPTALPR
jgi:citrate lyase subunit beta/citryl-CoA lyase